MSLKKHLKLTNTAKMTEEQWQDTRHSFTVRGMIGGSDAGTLLGLNKYKSSIELFYQSVGIRPVSRMLNMALLHGKRLEDYVADCWRYWDGTEEGFCANVTTNNRIKNYRKIKAIIENPDFPALFANIDGLITKHPSKGNKKGILEVKTIGGYASDMYEAGFPPTYLIQLQHYLMVCELTWGEIVYLKDGRDLGCVTFEADPVIQRLILDAANNFQSRVQQARTAIEFAKRDCPEIKEDTLYSIASEYEPPADNTEAFGAFLSDKHKNRLTETVIDGDPDLLETARKMKEWEEKEKSAKAEATLYKNQLKQYMEQHSASVMLLPNDSKVTWRRNFIVNIKTV